MTKSKITVTVSEKHRKWIDDQLASGDHGTASGLLASLIDEAQERKEGYQDPWGHLFRYNTEENWRLFMQSYDTRPVDVLYFEDEGILVDSEPPRLRLID